METALIPSSPMTRREFGVVFAKLAMQLRAVDVDEPTILSYYDALSGYPLEAVRMAAEKISREPGRRWLPTTGEFVQAIQDAQEATLRAAVTHRAEPWKVECSDCEDTGWIQGLTCDGGGEQWPEQAAKRLMGSQKSEHRGNKTAVGYKPQERATDFPMRPTCGRNRPHAPHSYTMSCPCRPTNRTYLRNQKFGKGESL